MNDGVTFTCRAVLFDLDGTLLDSAARIHRLWEWWSVRRGVDLQALLDVMHGRQAMEIIRLAAPHLVPEDEIEALETEEISDMYDVHIYPGALDLLTRLDGAPWGIVTSGSRRVAAARIRHVGLPDPPMLVTADLIHNGKPAPDGYLFAAQKLRVRPQDCIVIEDAPVGVEGGKAAGMRVIAIASTNPPESLRAADALVASLADIDLRVTSTGITVLAHSLRGA
jgi:sugar-phosphatase